MTFARCPARPAASSCRTWRPRSGKPSDGGKTWTYTLRPGLKSSDGTPITSADVKYAIERSNYAPDVLSNGPTYFNAAARGQRRSYQGPYKDKTRTDLTLDRDAGRRPRSSST